LYRRANSSPSAAARNGSVRCAARAGKKRARCVYAPRPRQRPPSSPGLFCAFRRTLCRQALVELRGVGFKVADCVALFSLDQPGAIPVDTHVWRIARRDFNDEQIQKCASVTPAIYDRVGDLFRDRFGAHAGWAHSLLFAAVRARTRLCKDSRASRGRREGS
jgi:hypothetical protein